MIDKKKIAEDCEQLINIAESSNTGADMLVCDSDYPEYEHILTKKGYKVSKHRFGLMSVVKVRKA